MASAERDRIVDAVVVQNHHTVQTSPNAPVMKNTQRHGDRPSQCTLVITPAISGGAMIPPTPVPALMMPIAVARSLQENHSATTRVAAGKPPPSPTPSSSRLAASMTTPPAKPWLAQASDQKIMMMRKPAARAEHVHQPAAADIHEAVGQQKGRIEHRLHLIGDRNVFPDLADGDRQRLTIEVADRDGGADEQRKTPAAGSRFFGGRPHAETICRLL